TGRGIPPGAGPAGAERPGPRCGGGPDGGSGGAGGHAQPAGGTRHGLRCRGEEGGVDRRVEEPLAQPEQRQPPSDIAETGVRPQAGHAQQPDRGDGAPRDRHEARSETVSGGSRQRGPGAVPPGRSFAKTGPSAPPQGRSFAKTAAPGLPQLRLTGRDPADAAELLAEHAGDLPRHVRDQILAQADGNPLALWELPVAQREGHLAAYGHGAIALPTHSRIQQMFTDRIDALPEPTRLLLLLAAADDTGDPAVVFAAAARLGIAITDLAPAEEKHLIRYDRVLAYRHP